RVVNKSLKFGYSCETAILSKEKTCAAGANPKQALSIPKDCSDGGFWKSVRGGILGEAAIDELKQIAIACAYPKVSLSVFVNGLDDCPGITLLRTEEFQDIVSIAFERTTLPAGPQTSGAASEKLIGRFVAIVGQPYGRFAAVGLCAAEFRPDGKPDIAGTVGAGDRGIVRPAIPRTRHVDLVVANAADGPAICEPDVSGGIFAHPTGRVCGPRGIFSEKLKPGRLQAVQPAPGRGNPKIAFVVLADAIDARVACFDGGTPIRGPTQETVSACSNPQDPIAALQERAGHGLLRPWRRSDLHGDLSVFELGQCFSGGEPKATGLRSANHRWTDWDASERNQIS